jgi:hypothetical protein
MIKGSTALEPTELIDTEVTVTLNAQPHCNFLVFDCKVTACTVYIVNHEMEREGLFQAAVHSSDCIA